MDLVMQAVKEIKKIKEECGVSTDEIIEILRALKDGYLQDRNGRR